MKVENAVAPEKEQIQDFAQEWLAKREGRRYREREEEQSSIETKGKAAVILKSQSESEARVFAKHPELNTVARMNALKAEGKS